MDGYDIDKAGARGAIASARSIWSGLHGLENSIEASGEAAATATQEDDINAAMSHAFTNFLRPFTVITVQMGDRAFDGADNVINIYETADSEMSDNAKAQGMAGALAESQELTSYNGSESTGGKRPEAVDGGYDW
ncbi:MAG: hypothetical protein QJR09_04235 [Micrococcus sp.]|nr:hypothetical protein [Micrococcus sp.]